MKQARTQHGAIGLILGSGSSAFKLNDTNAACVQTKYGPTSSALMRWEQAPSEYGWECVCLLRHGVEHTIPPHAVNYRANLKALADEGVEYVFALGAVGALDGALQEADLVLPDQLIDYTWGRESSYWQIGHAMHYAAFNQPFDAGLRAHLLHAAHAHHIPLIAGGCYAVTQGPRLETAAELRQLAQQGSSIVGMTAMPEAALARELGLKYALVCVVANQCDLQATLPPLDLQQVFASLNRGMAQAQKLIVAAMKQLNTL